MQSIKWKRFPNFYTSDYFWMSETYFDSVAFKPTVDIHLTGFYFFNHADKQPFTIMFKYNLNDADSEEMTFDIT